MLSSLCFPPPLPVDRNYYQCWLGLKSHFDPTWTPEKAAVPAGAKPAVASAGAKAAAAAQAGEQTGGQQNGSSSPALAATAEAS